MQSHAESHDVIKNNAESYIVMQSYESLNWETKGSLNYSRNCKWQSYNMAQKGKLLQEEDNPKKEDDPKMKAAKKM